MKIKFTIFLSVLFVITGCQNTSFKANVDEEQKIYIHQTTKNYGGLIELYKNRLQKSDNPETRYKLAQVYYLSNDFNSAKNALMPIIEVTKDDNVLVLYGHIESKLGNNDQALAILNKALAQNSKNGEAYNLKGIVLIKKEQHDAARYAFNQARENFYDENKVMNNLAMLLILNKEYNEAYNLLNILYNKGYRNKALLHNLLYTLVKLNQLQLAKSFISEHKISNSPVILIEELKQIDPVDMVKFNEIVPDQEQKQKQYSFEKITENQPNKMAISSNKLSSTPNDTPLPSNIASSQFAILSVRSGEHNGFTRIAFDSTKQLSQADYGIEQLSPKEFTITFHDVSISDVNANSLARNILHSNRDLQSVMANLMPNKKLIIHIQTKNPSFYKSFDAGIQTKRKIYRFVIDFYTQSAK